MKFIPLIVSTPLIQPIIRRQKVVTRRLAKLPSLCAQDMEHILLFGYKKQEIPCPYEIGDILWVKEEHFVYGYWDQPKGVKTPTGKQKRRFIDKTQPFCEVYYTGRFSTPCHQTTFDKWPGDLIGWYPRMARFMPAKYARLFLKIKNISLEKLNDITEKQAMDEGVCRGIYMDGPNNVKKEFHLELNNHGSYRDGFRFTIQTLHGLDIWCQNPAVWAISFELIDKPKNFPHAKF